MSSHSRRDAKSPSTPAKKGPTAVARQTAIDLPTEKTKIHRIQQQIEKVLASNNGYEKATFVIKKWLKIPG